MENHRTKKTSLCVSQLPPCNAVCPAGEDIQRWIYWSKKGEFQKSWKTILETNPFPSVHGRICYHYCETRCNRIQYDATVAIHCIERFVGDLAIKNGWHMDIPKLVTGKKVLIIGSGPAGLSAAYYLRSLGHEVTIYETLSRPGGMMMYGIPAYRLPKDILSREIERIIALGIKIIYNHRVTDVLAEKKAGNFDAIFLGIGAQVGNNLAININTSNRVTYAVDYLRGVISNNPLPLGEHLVVYGGGNTAIDVARTAKRLGTKKITIVYHRTRDKMSAFNHEISDARDEGIEFIFLRSILEFVDNFITVGINELDARGRPRSTGSSEKIRASALVFALNQIPETDFLCSIPGVDVQPSGSVVVDSFFMTGHRGIFAGGDMIPGERGVAIAVGAGRKAAYHINAYLQGSVFIKKSNANPALFEKLHISSDLSSFDKLNIDEEPTQQSLESMLDVNARSDSFQEVRHGLDRDRVEHEIRRCFSCGNCFGCGKCYNACPVGAIDHDHNGIVSKVNQETCIGCGKCSKICPCGAMVMVGR